MLAITGFYRVLCVCDIINHCYNLKLLQARQRTLDNSCPAWQRYTCCSSCCYRCWWYCCGIYACMHAWQTLRQQTLPILFGWSLASACSSSPHNMCNWETPFAWMAAPAPAATLCLKVQFSTATCIAPARYVAAYTFSFSERVLSAHVYMTDAAAHKYAQRCRSAAQATCTVQICTYTSLAVAIEVHYKLKQDQLRIASHGNRVIHKCTNHRQSLWAGRMLPDTLCPHSPHISA